MSNVPERGGLLTNETPSSDRSQGQWVPPQFPRELQSMAWPARRRRRWLLAAVLALALGAALLTVACGGGSSGSAIRITPGGAGTTLEMTVGDNFYKPNEFRVLPGEQVTLNVKNEGQAVHTVHLAGPDNRYETDDDTQIDPPMIKPGQTVSLVWS